MPRHPLRHLETAILTESFQCGRFVLDTTRPLIMGIVNLTDDSFSGDGSSGDTQSALDHAYRLIDEGAAILDIGAESSRPGAIPVATEQEIARLLPIIDGLRGCGVPLSIDTMKVVVMREALANGADMINDISGFHGAGALEAIAASAAAVCIMHMQGNPENMQVKPQYDEVVADVGAYLRRRVAAAELLGIARKRICIDPGFGFGKSLDHNLSLLRRLDELALPGIPLLVGLSRKSMLGQITGRAVAARGAASVAAQLLAISRGARIVRVHDVAAMRDAIEVIKAVEEW